MILELIRVTKPEGWIEFYDPCVKLINAGPNSRRLDVGVIKSMTNSGLNPYSITLMKPWLQSCSNLTNITELTRRVPIGVWEPNIGKLIMVDFLEFVDSQKSWIADGLSMSESEFLKLLELIKAEFSSTEYEVQVPFVRVFGQKI